MKKLSRITTLIWIVLLFSSWVNIEENALGKGSKIINWAAQNIEDGSPDIEGERQNLVVLLKLNSIICRDEGDGSGNAEPYLWTVFFKIDGQTIGVTEALMLSGNATIVTTPGSHGNLNVNAVDEGDTVSIPTDIGDFSALLRPIPIPESFPNIVKPLGGFIGVVCILMEEDNVSDDGAEAGHQALNLAVKNAINQIIATRSRSNTDVTEEELESFESDIQSAISNAIQNQQDIFENLWSGVNQDDFIGSKVFIFNHDNLAENKNINFNQRWRNEGDWEITGNVKTTGCSVELTSMIEERNSSMKAKRSSKKAEGNSSMKAKRNSKKAEGNSMMAERTAKSIDLNLIREFRNKVFKEHPNLKEWGNILLRNNIKLGQAILKDKQLKKHAIDLLRNATTLIKDDKVTLNDNILKNALPLIAVLEKSTNKGTQLDAKSLKEAIPLIKGKNKTQVIKHLNKNLPGIKPNKAVKEPPKGVKPYKAVKKPYLNKNLKEVKPHKAVKKHPNKVLPKTRIKGTVPEKGNKKGTLNDLNKKSKDRIKKID